jgi:hypothetical protein
MEVNMAIKGFINKLAIGPAWNHFNLTVHPLIVSACGKPFYLTLDEALTTGRFQISEVSETGRVPELKVINRLPQPVLLLDGEELIGAKQNRVLNLTIMMPAESEMPIPVSCVEAGRWRHVSDSFAGADRAQFARGRAKKLAQVSRSLCEFGERRSDQTNIWEEISAKAERMSARSPTGAMAAIYERSHARLDDFVHAMPRRDRQVGAIFSLNGQVAGVDIFDCANTFVKLSAKLIRSYAIDAMESPATTDSDGPTTDAVRAFLDDIADATATRVKALGLGDDLRLGGLSLAGAALEISQQIIHVVAFPASVYDDYSDDTGRSAHMARAQMRRRFH